MVPRRVPHDDCEQGHDDDDDDDEGDYDDYEMVVIVIIVMYLNDDLNDDAY